MADFKIIYYILIAMFAAILGIFSWGWITFNRIKTTEKFYNKPLITLTVVTGGIGFLLTFLPIFMKIWTYTSSDIKTNALFISFLVIEFTFLIAFLVLAYIFAFDFGITLDNNGNQLGFFGQVINSKKIVAIEEKKNCIKIIYEQGFKNLKKKLVVYSPKAKQYVKAVLAPVIATNLEALQAKALIDEKDNETIGDVQSTISPTDSQIHENQNINEQQEPPKPEDSNLEQTKIENNEK